MMWFVSELNLTIWAACILYMWPLKHRPRYGLRLFAMVLAGSAALTVTSIFLPDHIILQASCHFLLCAAGVCFCCAVPVGDAVYCATWAMITQQVAYEITYLMTEQLRISQPALMVGGTLLVFAGIYAVAGVTIVRYMPCLLYTSEIGPRDLENNEAVLVRRDTHEKITVSLDEIGAKVGELLETIQHDMRCV